jgi:hypothetical protein
MTKINRRRKRAIAKAEKEMDRYYAWQEHVEVTGGYLVKGKDGKLRGYMKIN